MLIQQPNVKQTPEFGPNIPCDSAKGFSVMKMMPGIILGILLWPVVIGRRADSRVNRTKRCR
jgi:hypothetical protein